MSRLRRETVGLDRMAARLREVGHPDYQDAPTRILAECHRVAREMTEMKLPELRCGWRQTWPDQPVPDWIEQQHARVLVRRKFVLIDWIDHPSNDSGSGVLAVDRESGEVWPVAAYGRPNRLYPLGHVANFTYRVDPRPGYGKALR